MLKNLFMSDIQIAEMKVHSQKEPFVDLKHFDPDILVDPTFVKRTPYFSYVRLTVANKLSIAKKYLPSSLHFYVKEGYRPLHLQQQGFEKSLQRVRETSGYHDKDYLYSEASKFVAPPEVAPHPTGGAIDLTLIDKNGIELDLGTVFDAVPQETDNATYFNATNISIEARENRQILASALGKVGFVNYFTEWWHWSYGDKYWATVSGQDFALFEPVSEQELHALIK